MTFTVLRRLWCGMCTWHSGVALRTVRCERKRDRDALKDGQERRQKATVERNQVAQPHRDVNATLETTRYRFLRLVG